MRGQIALREVLSWLRTAAAAGGVAPETSRTLRGAVLRARDSRVSDPTPELVAFRRSGRVRHAPTAYIPHEQKRSRCVSTLYLWFQSISGMKIQCECTESCLLLLFDAIWTPWNS